MNLIYSKDLMFEYYKIFIGYPCMNNGNICMDLKPIYDY